jgi:hypothetical protein
MGSVRYLPYVYLPDLDMFAEVKGVPDYKSALKVERLMEETGKDVALLLGNGRMQFFSAKFAGYSLNDNFGKGSCEYNSYDFNSLIDPDEGRYEPNKKKHDDLHEYEKVPERYYSERTIKEPKQKQQKIKVTIDHAVLQDVLNSDASFQRAWKAAVDGLKQKKQAYGVLFMNTHSMYDGESETIKIKYPKEAVFAFSAAQKPEVIEALTDSLNTVFGSPVSFEYEKESVNEE